MQELPGIIPVVDSWLICQYMPNPSVIGKVELFFFIMLCLNSQQLPSGVSPGYVNRVVLIHDAVIRCGVCVVFQMLGCLVVETVYPVAGFCRMPDWEVDYTKCTVRDLADGSSFRELDNGPLLAGSQAEGLALDEHWGHGKVDRDVMWPCGEDLGVHVLHPGNQPPEDATLVYTPQGCPPAYSRLQVLRKDKLLEAIARCKNMRFDLSLSASDFQQCVFSEGSHLWLHSRKTLEALLARDTIPISGPAGQDNDGFDETVHSLVCSGPHPSMASYKKRTRNRWPSTALLDAIVKQPMVLVMVGPKYAQDSYLMFRISWSPLEYILLTSLDLWLKQGYVCFKYTIKSLLKSLRPTDSAGDGRSLVGSYHLKTVFLRHLEGRPSEQEESPFQLMLDLCQDLQHYLLLGCLPHYFLPECDLLRTVENEERQCALRAVGQIIADPLATILRSPSEPHLIYGCHTPDDLVHCFGEVSS